MIIIKEVYVGVCWVVYTKGVKAMGKKKIECGKITCPFWVLIDDANLK